MNGGWKHFMVLTFRVSERGSMHLLDLASERASDIVTPPSCHPPVRNQQVYPFRTDGKKRSQGLGPRSDPLLTVIYS